MNRVDVAVRMERIEFEHVKGEEVGVFAGRPPLGINHGYRSAQVGGELQSRVRLAGTARRRQGETEFRFQFGGFREWHGQISSMLPATRVMLRGEGLVSPCLGRDGSLCFPPALASCATSREQDPSLCIKP